MGKRSIISIVMGGYSLVSGHQCQIFASSTSVVKCSRFYCYFNLEMITKYLVELYNLFSALMLPAQGSKRECSVNKI